MREHARAVFLDRLRAHLSVLVPKPCQRFAPRRRWRFPEARVERPPYPHITRFLVAVSGFSWTPYVTPSNPWSSWPSAMSSRSSGSRMSDLIGVFAYGPRLKKTIPGVL